MIELRGVTRRFGAITALADVSLSISPGEAIVIQGPSGSGKTTLLRLIAGLELPDKGEITLGGALASQPGWGTPPYRRSIGFVFQRNALWPHMTVSENILFAMDGLPADEKHACLDEILAKTSLLSLAKRYPGQLSGGEARRAAIGRALAGRPMRLLLDEPLTNLDPQLKAQLLQIVLNDANSRDATLVYVTHDAEEIHSVQGRVLRLECGRLV